jgi:glucosamine--fructose-6-phosphate aminotransferase (isomerizing)
MCGIIGYIGKRDAFPIVIKGLERMEYRGYDSAGVAILDGSLHVFKKKGKVADLYNFAKDSAPHGSIGIGHTRWATHGIPNDVNAHPHLSESGKIAIIHNGIIENYAVLKDALLHAGHTFKSETDTEVLVHLIETIKEKDTLSLFAAVQQALTQVVGAYGIVVMDETDPDTLVCARKGSPLVLGIGNEEFFIASDASPIVEYTKKVVYLENDQIAELKRNGEYKIETISGTPHTPFVEELTMEAEAIGKEGYDHYMQKEIFEQATTIHDALRGHILPDLSVHLRGVEEMIASFNGARRLIITACGTSWIAGLVGEYFIENLARIPVEVEYASEFRYRNPVLDERDIVIAISQSGETADTLAALELAKARGAKTYGIVNAVGSSIARMTDAGSYMHVGPEIGVASTKAFTGATIVLALLALLLAKDRSTLDDSAYEQLVTSLEKIDAQIADVLATEKQIIEIAERIKDKDNALFLGRGILFPVALEGALKLKEISYIHAEGYPAGEMKHGPIALVEADFPVVVVATNKELLEKVISNVQEVKARGALTIGIVREGDTEAKKIFDYTIEAPNSEELWMPILSVIPLQLLAYHVAVLRGLDVDKPRNLAKSVTVE